MGSDRATLDRASTYVEDCVMGLIRFNKDLDLKSALVRNHQQIAGYKVRFTFIVNNPIAKDWDNAKEVTFDLLLVGLEMTSLERCATSAVDRMTAIQPNRLVEENEGC